MMDFQQVGWVGLGWGGYGSLLHNSRLLQDMSYYSRLLKNPLWCLSLCMVYTGCYIIWCSSKSSKCFFGKYWFKLSNWCPPPKKSVRLYRVSQKKCPIAIFSLNLFQRCDYTFSHVFRNQNFEPVPSKHFKHTHSEY